jgi:DNA-binding transcriptional MerR regulator/methylmalonyl-CoA mutase cobalamin-binding subunit
MDAIGGDGILGWMAEGSKGEVAEPTYSIGDLAEACGISVDTLRIWERRYGRPEPLRLPSGHRRYTPAHVRWLRRVAAALAAGHRARAVVTASEEELDRLIGSGAAAEPAPEEIDPFLEAALAYRDAPISKRLWDGWRRLGPEPFLGRILGPLLARAGRAWADGTMGIRHEHFLSEVIEHFLRAARASLPMPRAGRQILLTALEGERHGFGIQMAAIVSAGAKWRPRVLGVSTPLDEIVRCAVETKAEVVGISVSLHTGGVESDRKLADLRARLAPEVRMIVGGAGARGVRRGPRGVAYGGSLEALGRFLRSS